jgi:hypothetical protein
MNIKRLASFISVFSFSVVAYSVLTISNVSAATVTWDGGGDKTTFTDATNWAGNAVPQNGDSLVFPDDENMYALSHVDLGSNSISLAGITFTGTNENFPEVHLNGSLSTVTLTGDVEIGETKKLFFGVDVNLADSISMVTKGYSGGSSSGVYFTGALQLNSFDLTLEARQQSGDPEAIPDGVSFFDLPKFEISNGPISGSGDIIIKRIAVNFNNSLSSSTGGLVADSAGITFNECSDFFAGYAGAISLTNSQLFCEDNTDVTIDSPITIGGNVLDFKPTKDDDGSFNEALVFVAPNVTLTGDVTLTADILVYRADTSTKFTGNFSGNYLIGATGIGDTGTLQIAPAAGKTNSSSTMLNGTYAFTTADSEITDDQNTLALVVQSYKTVTITQSGKRGYTVVGQNGTLKGLGTVGQLNILSGGHVAPGNSPGCLNAGNTTFNSGSSFDVEIAGNTVCTEYDQLKVTGTINLGNASLNTSFLNGFKPSAGASFTVVEASSTLSGTFNNLPEGATFTVDGVVFKVSYAGNKVTITVQNVPGTPNTGLKLLMANPLVTMFATTAVAGALFALSRKFTLNAVKTHK